MMKQGQGWDWGGADGRATGENLICGSADAPIL
jgi:hypothetical protein